MKYVICILFFFWMKSVLAQEVLIPFIDKHTQLTGFRNNKKDTIYPARFNVIQEINDPISEWILSDGKKTGCLNRQNTWIIPLAFDRIIYHDLEDLLEAQNPWQFRLYDKTGQEIIPRSSYPFQFKPLSNRIACVQVYNEKKHSSLYSITGKQLIPWSHDITEVYIQVCDPWHDSGFPFLYYKYSPLETHQTGIIRSDSTVIVPPYYEDVEFISFAQSCVSENAYFLAKNSGHGNYHIFQLNGGKENQFTDLTSLEPLQTLSHLYRKEAPPFFEGTRYSGEQDLHLILDRKTGKMSANYSQLESFGNFFIGFRETEADLIDTNLRVITTIPFTSKMEIDMPQSDKYPPFNTLQSYERDEHTLFYANYAESFRNKLFAVAIITKHDQPTKKQARKGTEKITRKQLLHLESGKLVPKEYLDIYRVISGQNVYFWALKDTNSPNQVFDIYNDHLDFLQVQQILPGETFYPFRKLSGYEESDYLLSKERAELFYLENGTGKLAVLHRNGTRLSGFIWDRRVTVEGLSTDSTLVFLVPCEKDTTLCGVLVNQSGEPLFGKFNANTHFMDGHKYYSIYSPESKEFRILSATFEILIDSVRYFHNTDPSVLTRNYPLYKNNANRLFIHTPEGISPLYPSFFNTPDSINRISKSGVFFVDAMGYLIQQ